MNVDYRIRALPCWQGNIVTEPLTGGLSNENYLVTDATGRHVVRFGEDYPFHHVDRAREVANARAAHAAGFAPAVEFATPGVMVTEYLDAATWSARDVQAQPEKLAGLLRRFHNEMPQHITGSGYLFWVFHVIRDYARTLVRQDSPWASRLPELLAIADLMEAAQMALPIIFGHGDMLPANILEDENRLWLIDFEYAGFSTAMFDLSGAASNAGLDETQSDRLLSTYFDAPPTEELRRSFDAMQCASLMREAMWAMVSEIYLKTPGVDFNAYARENMAALETALSRYHSLHGKTAS